MPCCLPGCESQCDNEENVQCVPTSFNDDHLSQDSPNNPGSQQVTATSSFPLSALFVACCFYRVFLEHIQRQIGSKSKTKS